MTVVYLDSVFLFNALLDYLLVLSAARLAGLTLRRGRYILCGLSLIHISEPTRPY